MREQRTRPTWGPSLFTLTLLVSSGCSSGPRAEPATTTPTAAEIVVPATTTDEVSTTDAQRGAFLACASCSPLDRALLACTTLLGDARFVGPSSPRPEGISDATWRLVHEPTERYRADRRELAFFALVDGVVVEAHVDALSAEIETIPLASIAARASEPTCEAPTRCGCFDACAEVVRIGPEGPDARYRTLGATSGGLELRRTPQCYEGTCARVCQARGQCVDALSATDETCTGACAPAEAGFHCARGPSGCMPAAHGP